MKQTTLYFLLIAMLVMSCGKDDNNDEMDDPIVSSEFKNKMRSLVIDISTYAKGIDTDFYIIPQNGIELVTSNGDDAGQPDNAYLSAIDGHGQEDLFYGYNNDDDPTPSIDNAYLRTFLDMSKNAGNTILVTDYCSTQSHMDDSYVQNSNSGYVSFAADHRELDDIPAYPMDIANENNSAIESLSDVQNFLYLINPDNFATKAAFIQAMVATNYDLLIMDLFFHDGSEFTLSELQALHSKANGGSRVVISYMSIGEAEDYRYYWDNDWYVNEPTWLDGENPNWAGNYKVKYWDPEWQSIIFGNDQSYLKKILNAGFDGVYLDIIDAYEYYE